MGDGGITIFDKTLTEKQEKIKKIKESLDASQKLLKSISQLILKTKAKAPNGQPFVLREYSSELEKLRNNSQVTNEYSDIETIVTLALSLSKIYTELKIIERDLHASIRKTWNDVEVKFKKLESNYFEMTSLIQKLDKSGFDFMNTVLAMKNTMKNRIIPAISDFQHFKIEVGKCQRNTATFEFQNAKDTKLLEKIEQNALIHSTEKLQEMQKFDEHWLLPNIAILTQILKMSELQELFRKIQDSGAEEFMQTVQSEVLPNYQKTQFTSCFPENWESFKIFTKNDFVDVSSFSYFISWNYKHVSFRGDELSINIQRFLMMLVNLRRQYKSLQIADIQPQSTTIDELLKSMDEFIRLLNELFPECIVVRNKFEADNPSLENETITSSSSSDVVSENHEPEDDIFEFHNQIDTSSPPPTNPEESPEPTDSLLNSALQPPTPGEPQPPTLGEPQLPTLGEPQLPTPGKRQLQPSPKEPQPTPVDILSAEAELPKNHEDRVKLLSLIGVSGVSLSMLMYYTFRRLKHYFRKRRMWSKLEYITPKPMWILVQPFSSASLSPIRVTKIRADNMFPFDAVYDVITSVLNITGDEVILKQTHFGRSTRKNSSQRQKTSPQFRPDNSYDAPHFGFQTSMTVDLLPEIKKLLIVELKREGLVTDELLRLTKREAKFYLNHEKIYIPVLM